jgi:histone-lysine N-methyltransferase SETMAR
VLLVIFDHYKKRPLAARFTKQKLRRVILEVLPTPSYSSLIALSSYHLFRSLQHFHSGKIFDETDVTKAVLSNFFSS